jgi:hypothetical protein
MEKRIKECQADLFADRTLDRDDVPNGESLPAKGKKAWLEQVG